MRSFVLFFVVFTGFSLGVQSGGAFASQEVSIEKTLAEYLHNGHPTIVEFGSVGCSFCLKNKHVLSSAQEKIDRKLNVLTVDVAQHEDISLQYRVKFVPTTVFFSSGGEEVDRIVGRMNEHDVLDRLKWVD